ADRPPRTDHRGGADAWQLDRPRRGTGTLRVRRGRGGHRRSRLSGRGVGPVGGGRNRLVVVDASRSWRAPSAAGFGQGASRNDFLAVVEPVYRSDLFAFLAWVVEYGQAQDAVLQPAPCGLDYTLINSRLGLTYGPNFSLDSRPTTV